MSDSVRFQFAFAGDRQVALEVLSFLVKSGQQPTALLVSDTPRASHVAQLRELCADLADSAVLTGSEFRTAAGMQLLRGMRLDVVVGIHFPYLVPPEVLSIPRLGWLNLHPAYLPFNRGWHTPSWAILEETVAGATLHFMDDGIDTGDIVARLEVPIGPADTADSLYQKVLAGEVQLFRESWPLIRAGTFARFQQEPEEGTAHLRSDLLQPSVQELRLDDVQAIGDTLRQLRALTTSDPSEAAFFVTDQGRYRVQVSIYPDSGDG